MIVIPRKKGESVVFGDDIILTVIEIRGDNVRLGIEHPMGVTVHEKQADELAAASSPTASGETAIVAALHEEIARLPERFREAILICHLEGVSTAAAAQRLGCSQGTILSRLSRARERLRRRMTGRGLAVPADIFVASGVPPARVGALPAPLLSATVAAAWPALAGRTALAESVTPSVEH